MRLVLVGPPGAGKGTQAQYVAQYLIVPKISTGDIFRANVGQGTPLGMQAKAFMDAGDLVPDEVTIQMVRDRLAEDDAVKGFLLDGFPRNLPQARVLDTLLLDLGGGVDAVLEMVVDDDEVVRRLSGRRTCRQCGRIWHIDFEPPTTEDICDGCGGPLFQRDDDKESAVAHRLAEYDERTRPLIDYFRGRSRFHTINGYRPVGTVFAELSAIVGAAA